MPSSLKRMTGRYLNSLWKVKALHALYREDGRWYHHLSRFPGALFDANGYVVFRTREEYDRSPYLQHGEDLHVIEGIATMPNYILMKKDSGAESRSHV